MQKDAVEKVKEALRKIRDFPLYKEFEYDEYGEIKNGSSSHGPGYAAYRQQYIAREALTALEEEK